jgi:flagellar M-ring protein FliF
MPVFHHHNQHRFTNMSNAEQALNTPVIAMTNGGAGIPLPQRSWLTLGAGAAALIALVTAAFMWSQQPDYRVLFANVTDKDGGAIIAQLSQMNIPYKHADGGGAILIPSDKVHDVRLKLASQGLPKGGNIGFELLEGQKFGATQFQEQVNYQRGLEGELARSIQALASVQTARVHLAIPKQSVFLREQQKPSASVVVSLHAGRTLDRAQVAGIVHLVSSSVPDLPLKSVSILDQTGALLSQNADGSTMGTLDPTQISYVRELEDNLTRRILDIVEPMAGRGNVRAQVASEIDFSVVESTAEIFTPNQGSDTKAAIRSQSTAEAGGNASGNTPSGVPGATSNQPPVAPTAPISGSAGGVGGTNSPAGGINSGSGKRESIVNYEVDKTIRRTKNQTGIVKRLSTAVVVNHRKSTDTAGKVSYTPMTDAEITQINALVKEAIGFNKERGDSLNVVNAPFSAELEVPATAIPWYQNQSWISLGKEIGKGAAYLLGIAFIVFGVIRPAMKQIAAPPATAQRTPMEMAAYPGADDGGAVAALPAPGADRMQNVREIAKSDPAVVANVVRQWVSKNG